MKMIFNDPIVDLYLEQRYGKTALLVVVKELETLRIDTLLIPFLQPKNHIQRQQIDIPYNDHSLEEMHVSIPVLKITDDIEMIWRT